MQHLSHTIKRLQINYVGAILTNRYKVKLCCKYSINLQLNINFSQALILTQKTFP